MRLACLFFVLAACVPAPATVIDASLDAAAEDAAQPMDAAPDATLDAGVDQDSGEPEDSGASIDAAPLDSGPSHCPSSVNPACTSAAACGDDVPPPTNCDTCVVSNDALCVEGACETPPILDFGDIYGITTQVEPTVPLLESIAAFVLTARTAGDAVIDCDDVYAASIDLSDRCYNVIESKSANVSQTGDTYTFSFNGFTSGQHTLFILYGHGDTGAGGPAVGVSCTELDVGPPTGGMTQFVAGDRMRAL